ncbi:abortive infection family protein [Lactococcus formosensis]|uniref:abortive infection family protein n=1 Tax=Lactococcus formosensis TaxID=1281486 RepID=UPI002434876A|nr:abortive infection family protein [Lactococcus formosensis]MDG6122969.1 abortive infection family protein [Lactococcus formosensis]
MFKNQKDEFNFLKNRQIIDILIGDTKFSDESSLPYWSGPKLSELSTMFGLPVAYGSQSRWMYLNELLDYCIREGTVPQLLNFLFQKERFTEKFQGFVPKEIDEKYSSIIQKALDQINGVLYFSYRELVRVGNNFTIKKLGTSINIEAPSIKIIDNDYIQNLSNRALRDISNSEFDSALTKARTLLEEVFCYVIEKREEEPNAKGDIRKLYNQVKGLYNMHQDKSTDNRINNLLSGLEKIVTAISEMRNNGSDAHGVGSKRIGIKDYHARLFINSATSMAEFILSVEKSFSKEVIKS